MCVQKKGSPVWCSKGTGTPKLSNHCSAFGFHSLNCMIPSFWGFANFMAIWLDLWTVTFWLKQFGFSELHSQKVTRTYFTETLRQTQKFVMFSPQSTKAKVPGSFLTPFLGSRPGRLEEPMPGLHPVRTFHPTKLGSSDVEPLCALRTPSGGLKRLDLLFFSPGVPVFSSVFG